jgi:predicted dehydrogenase
MTTFGVAVIGPGRISLAHLTAIASARDICELVAIAGLPTEADRLRELAERFGARRVHTSIADVLSDPDVDAVVITLPNHLHEEVTIAALKAGKHVLVEKPIALDVASLDRMRSSAESADLVLMAGQCRRFFRAIQETREQLSHHVGPIAITHTLGVHFDEAPTGWWRDQSKTGGGVALGLNGPHAVDTILYLSGDRNVETVFARATQLNADWAGSDEVSLTVGFDDGSLATAYISFNTTPEVNERIINTGADSYRIVGDRSLTVNQVKTVEEEGGAYVDGDVSFNRQMREFVTACVEGREPATSVLSVRNSVIVLEAATRSILTGKLVILKAGELRLAD